MNIEIKKSIKPINYFSAIDLLEKRLEDLYKNKKKELIIKVDRKYYRPLEIDYLKGNPKKALRELKYKLKHSLKDLVKDMLDSDISIFKKKNK